MAPPRIWLIFATLAAFYVLFLVSWGLPAIRSGRLRFKTTDQADVRVSSRELIFSQTRPVEPARTSLATPLPEMAMTRAAKPPSLWDEIEEPRRYWMGNGNALVRSERPAASRGETLRWMAEEAVQRALRREPELFEEAICWRWLEHYASGRVLATWRLVRRNETGLYFYDSARDMLLYAPLESGVALLVQQFSNEAPYRWMTFVGMMESRVREAVDKLTKAPCVRAAAEGSRVHVGQVLPGCKHYTVVYNCQPSQYFEWQSRVSYFWFKRTQPPQLANWRRLLSSKRASGDHLMASLPTYVAKRYDVNKQPAYVQARFNRTQVDYVPYNKPYALMQFLEANYDRETGEWRDVDEIILLIDPDCALIEDVSGYTRLVERGKPIAQHGFMSFAPGLPRSDPTSLLAHRYCHNCTFADPIAVPVYVHRDDMLRIVPLWIQKIAEIRVDEPNWLKTWNTDSVQLPWCAEMYGYIFAAAELGIRHLMLEDLQNLGTDIVLHAPIIHYSLPVKVDANRTWHKASVRAGVDIPWPLPPKLNPVARRLLAELRDARAACPPTNATWRGYYTPDED